MAFAPNSRTTSLCGVGRCLFRGRWQLNPTAIRHPPAGAAGHSSLRRQRRLTRRKPTLPGAEQSRVRRTLVSSYGHSTADICRYRLVGHRNGMTHGFRRGAPDLVCGAHSHFCRYRCKAPRHIPRQWFRGGAGAVVKVSGLSTPCHRAHDGTGAPATSWPANSRATDGLKQVMPATGGPTTHPGGWQVRGRSNRYRQKPAGTLGRTTKPPIFESLIALLPAGRLSSR